VPEQTHLPVAVEEALADYANSGGCVLMTGAHLAGAVAGSEVCC